MGVLALLILSAFPRSAVAVEQMIHLYVSPRSAAMGGVKLTTGQYEENFFGNPARASFNPSFRAQLPDPMVETTLPTISSLSSLTAASLAAISGTVGSNLHGRFQMTFPGFYFSAGKSNFGIAVVSMAQIDFLVRRAYEFDPFLLVDVGPALSFSQKFLENDRLTIGTNLHFRYRISSTDPYTLVQVLQAVAPFQNRGEGAMFDFDLGATFRPEFKPWGWQFLLSGVVSNLLGGNYGMIPLRILGSTTNPVSQPRSFGFGVALRNESLWIFEKPVFAVELTDVTIPTNGSIFRSIHMGTEMRLKLLALRLGLYQGYISGGLGLNLKILQLDLTTYGEEMALNAGGFESRNFAVRFNLKI